MEIMITPTQFTSKQFPNCHIEFDNKGTKLRISLNIEPVMVKYMSKNNVFKGDFMYVYTIASYVDDPCLKTLGIAYKRLMARAMKNCRIAKQQVLQKEINQLRLIYKN